MSGGTESVGMDELDEDSELEVVIKRFKVDKKTAEDIIGYSTEKAQIKFQKWHDNSLVRRKRTDEEKSNCTKTV